MVSKMMKVLFTAFVVFASVAVATKEETKKDINVNLYYESLCPGCQQLIKESIGGMLDDPCFKAANWTLIPYGNARQREQDGKFVTQCQHGELECHRNKEELCTIKYLKDIPQEKLVKTIICMEEHTEEHEAPVKTCVKKHHRELVRRIQTCTRSDEGDDLVNVAAQKTHAVPNREYVPWLMINGQHGNEQAPLRKQLCDASDKKSKECCSSENWAKAAFHDVENFFGNLFHKSSKKSLKGSKFPTCPVEEVITLNRNSDESTIV